jgi:predicted nucleic acid-binding protein
MLVLLDSNIFFSAMLVKPGLPARIIRELLDGGFELVTCQEQIDEIRKANRKPALCQPSHHGSPAIH